MKTFVHILADSCFRKLYYSKQYFYSIFLLLVMGTGNLSGTVTDGAPMPVQKTGNWASLKMTWTTPEVTDSFFGCKIGNGRIGATIKGGVASDVIALNNSTFWSGGPGVNTDPTRATAMNNTRAKLAVGDYAGADAAARGMWGPQLVGVFLPVGSIVLDFDNTSGYTNYSRVLDLDRATSTTSYTVGGVSYTREVFASYPDNVVAVRLSSSAIGQITFTANMTYPTQMEGHGAAVSTTGGNTIIMVGRAPVAHPSTWDAVKGMKIESRLRIINSGGTLSAIGNSLRVVGADSVVLLYSSATSYNGFDKEPGTQGVDPSPIVQSTISAAAASTYNQILSNHLVDHQNIFRRLWVDVNGAIPNPYALGFQYARYEMISSSRYGDRPHNQQGIWNHSWTPASFSCHFLNENVEKYYGLIETANLSECSDPLWNWISELATNGAISAQTDWGFSSGWLAPHYSDIWASTSTKGGNNEWSIWPMGGIWLCNNLYDHYCFSRDANYLGTVAYPIMKGAAQFALNLLVNDGTGALVTSPSSSPENRFAIGTANYAVCRGTGMDLALIRKLFEDCIIAQTILNVDPALKSQLQSALAQLKPLQINSDGGLREWEQDVPDYYVRHRHASHIIAAWPLGLITQRDTPALFNAARIALTNRGTGGYHPDKGAMWARLLDGDKAIASNGSFPTGNGISGQFPPKYAGFPELLVQSNDSGEIDLLPALPTTWTSGNVAGIRARGDYELSLSWSGGVLTSCRIDSHRRTTPTIRYQGAIINPATDSRITLVMTGALPAAGTYRLRCVASGLLVDNLGQSYNNAPVAQSTDASATKQQWILTYVSPSVVKLQCVSGGRFIDGAGRTHGGDTVVQWDSSPSNNQRWTIVNLGGGLFKLKNVATGMCLDIGGSPWPDGDLVQQWPDGGAQNTHQQWQFLAL